MATRRSADASAERLSRLLTASEPSDVRQYIAVLRPGRPYAAGSTVPLIGAPPADIPPASSLSVPLANTGTARIPYFSAYLTFSEYASTADLGLDEDPRQLIETLASQHPRRAMLSALSGLNHAASNRTLLNDVRRKFQDRLLPEPQNRFEQAMSGRGIELDRVFLARQLVLHAMRLVLLNRRRATNTLGLSPHDTAILLTHAIGDQLQEIPDTGAEVWPGLPIAPAMEVVQNYLFHQTQDVAGRLDRVHRLWTSYGPTSKRARARATPIDLLFEATGLRLEEIQAIGVLIWAQLVNWASSDPLLFDLREVPGLTEATISAFARFAAADERQLARRIRSDTAPWQLLPFQQSPVLKSDGQLLVLDETFLIDRITNGLYWAVHDHERRIDDTARLRWSQTYAEMIERLALDDLNRMAPRLIGEGGGTTFFSESIIRTAYRGKQCDAAIFYGTEWVFFEIVSGQLSVESRQQGSYESFLRDTERLILKKARQLHEAGERILQDPARLLAYTPPPGRPALAVCLQGGQYPVNPVTMAIVDSRLTDENLLPQPHFRPLMIIDFGELEMLNGLTSRGHSLPQLLRKWQESDIRTFSLRNYLLREFGAAPELFRSPESSGRIDGLFREITARLSSRTTLAPRRT